MSANDICILPPSLCNLTNALRPGVGFLQGGHTDFPRIPGWRPADDPHSLCNLHKNGLFRIFHASPDGARTTAFLGRMYPSSRIERYQHPSLALFPFLFGHIRLISMQAMHNHSQSEENPRGQHQTSRIFIQILCIIASSYHFLNCSRRLEWCA
jgi:hypothetical protein